MTEEDPIARKMIRALVIDDQDEPSPDPPGVGTRTPEVWLVADRLPGRARSTMPLHTAAGRALVWPLVDPERHRVSNAQQGSTIGVALRSAPSRINLAGRWQDLGRPATIALGQAVALALEREGVPLHGKLSHPQFVWRFRQHAIKEYVAELRALLDAVHAAPPAIAREVPESDEIRAVRQRLAAAPGKFLVVSNLSSAGTSGLERPEAHNLTRRLRRAGGLRVVMRRLSTGAYAVLAREDAGDV